MNKTILHIMNKSGKKSWATDMVAQRNLSKHGSMEIFLVEAAQGYCTLAVLFKKYML